MHRDKQPADNGAVLSRWTLIRDIAVFQVKLIVDGLRDLMLLPVSLIAGVVSLLSAGPAPGPHFHDLLRVGRRSEHWINLFGAADRADAPRTEDLWFPAEDIDDLVSRVESFIVDEYHNGGLTAQAKHRLDQALDRLGEIAHRKQKNTPNQTGV